MDSRVLVKNTADFFDSLRRSIFDFSTAGAFRTVSHCAGVQLPSGS